MVKKNKWVDIHRVMTSLNTAPDPKKEFITRGDLKATFARLEAMGTVTSKESEAILRKIETDDLFEKEGAHVGQLDYRKNFLNHYMPEEIKLHSMVYPYWKDCAEKFERFSGGVAGTLAPKTVQKRFQMGVLLEKCNLRIAETKHL